MALVATFVQVLITVLSWAIIIRALITWFPIAPDSPIVRVLDDITEPIMAPLRRVVPRIGMLDITPIVALLLLQLLGSILSQGLQSYF